MNQRSRRTSVSGAVAALAVLAVAVAACSKGRVPGRAADGAKGAQEEPWAHHGSEPDGWWKTWALEEPPFPVGTRFELETIDIDGMRRASVVPDVPFPIQAWCRPIGKSNPLHLWDPPADGTVPVGTHLTRLVRVQKP